MCVHPSVCVCVRLSGLWPPVKRRGGTPLLSTGRSPALPRLPHPPPPAAGPCPPAAPQLPTPRHRAVRKKRRGCGSHRPASQVIGDIADASEPQPLSSGTHTLLSQSRAGLKKKTKNKKGFFSPPSRAPFSRLFLRTVKT